MLRFPLVFPLMQIFPDAKKYLHEYPNTSRVHMEVHEYGKLQNHAHFISVLELLAKKIGTSCMHIAIGTDLKEMVLKRKKNYREVFGGVT
jgi:hypothetical protein